MILQELLDKITDYNPRADFALIKKAFYYAETAHAGQLRINGEDWMQHPLKTADKLADLKMDSSLIAASLLHDVVEDTPSTLKDIAKEFNKEIARLVNGVTKVSAVKYGGAKQYLEKLQRLFIVLAADPRVILIKLADRLHNLSTLEALPREKKKRIAKESLTIFAPIADRLGLGQLKGEIEDLAFKFTKPQEYQWVKKTAADRIKQQMPFLKKVQKQLRKKLKTQGIEVLDIHLRMKRNYTLYQKLTGLNSNIDRVYDLNVIRVIVANSKECYNTLGIIHDIWRPLKGHIKDYIAQPKTNGYQSLHTTVFTRPQMIEFQIKTESMHRQAEEGIAYFYATKQKKEISNLLLVKEIINLQKEFVDQKRYLDILKKDVFQTHITVFTPHGDMIALPINSTPIDFAYRIHSDIGNKAEGVKVNDKIVPLRTELNSGDIVEIITNPRQKSPDKKWLKIAKTQYARYQIHKALKK